MKSLTAEESLWVILPIILLIVALFGGIVYFSNVSNNETRSKASEPKSTVTGVPAFPTGTPILMPSIYEQTNPVIFPDSN